MSLMARTALLQARVTPEIKQASEHILRQLGLNMTEAMELFLRRVIIDERIPFELVALDDTTLATATSRATAAAINRSSTGDAITSHIRKHKKHVKRE